MGELLVLVEIGVKMGTDIVGRDVPKRLVAVLQPESISTSISTSL